MLSLPSGAPCLSNDDDSVSGPAQDADPAAVLRRIVNELERSLVGIAKLGPEGRNLPHILIGFDSEALLEIVDDIVEGDDPPRGGPAANTP